MIVIIDYGRGNLRSVEKAFQSVGVSVKISRDPECILKADGLVLPGVGAFPDCMKNIRAYGLIEPIKRCIDSGRPFLGICLGMQLLMERGYEQGVTEGLAIIPGEVVRFPEGMKVPHMGWNTAAYGQAGRNNLLLREIDNESFFYFVHSYYVVPRDTQVVALTTDYNGTSFCSMLAWKNIYGMQFHPEKSQHKGLQILKNFGKLVNGENTAGS